MLYIRFGRVPKHERSKNYATGQIEQDVSAHAALRTAEGLFIFDEDQPLYNWGTMVFLIGKETYLLQGRRVGWGSDGEPLLRSIRILGKLHYDATCRGFRLLEKEEEGKR